MALDIEKICRTCLALNGPLLSIYDSNGTTGCVADMLRDFTQIDPKKHDGMPEKVCLLCLSEINRSYSFKMKCENSERMLKQLVPVAVCSEMEKENNHLENGEDLEIKSVKDGYVAKQDVIIEQTLIMKCENGEELDQEENVAGNLEESTCIDEQDVEDFITSIAAEENSKKVQVIRNQFVNMDNSRSEQSNQRENFVYEMQEQVDDETETVETAYYLISDAQQTAALQKYHNENIDSDQQEDGENDHHDCPPVFTIENIDDKCKPSELNLTEVKPEHTMRMTRQRKTTIKNFKVRKEVAKKVREEIKCTLCPMTFVFWNNLSRHYQKHHSIRQIRLKNNEIIHTEPERSNNGKINVNTNGTYLNVLSAPIDNPVPVPVIEAKHHCLRCNAGFARQKSLNNHLKQNKCTAQAFACHQCKKVFVSEENLQEHLLSHTQQFECTLCYDKFDDNDKYNNHMIDAHNRKMKYRCKYDGCKKAFTMMSTYKDHLRIHTGERPFLCSTCGKSFSQSANLKQHQMRHNKTKPFECDNCHTSFVSKGELFSHKRVHTGDHPFSCNVCEAHYTTASSLAKHKRKHTGERPYACEFCPMRFSALNILKNHRRTHTGEKPFKCKHCNRAFAQKSDCTTHMRTHAGKQSFICSVCDMMFNVKEELEAHFNTHYSDILEGEEAFKKSQQDRETNELATDDDDELTDELADNEEFIEIAMQ